MGKQAARVLTSLALAAASLALIGGCNDIVGVNFGAVHAAEDGGDDGTVDDGSGDDSGEGGTCTPKTCMTLGFTCGTQNDGCDNALDCGTCPNGQQCGGGQCQCIPTTCPAVGAECGTVDDGCGHALDCGTCTTADQACQNNKCACAPQSCMAQGAECGTVPDGCGGTYDCGACATDAGAPNCGGNGPNKCGANPCVPLTCTGLCGSPSDGCGHVLSCPACTSPQTCGGAGKANVCGCTPTTCTAQGKNCGSIPDGCGNMLDCGTCTTPETCAGGGTANVCGCTPLTSCPAGDNCGTWPNGCGNNLDCGTCTGYDTCAGGGVANVCGCTIKCTGCCGGANGCGGSCPVIESCCGGGCFVAGTMITMADGTFEPIDRMRAGELVRAYDAAKGDFVAAAVTAVLQHDPEASSAGIVVINGTLRVTTNHPIWVDGRRVRADELDLGSPILLLPGSGRAGERLEGRRDVVRSLELVAGEVPTFDLRVGEPGTYVADGIVVFLKDDPP
jgi:hypothetical protein